MNTKLKIALAAGGLAFAAQAAAQVTFYENEYFQGRSFTAQQRVDDFERFGFNDRASSAVVVGARWEVCNDIRFGGDCAVLRPGRYPSLSSLGVNDRVFSARAIRADALIDEERYAPAAALEPEPRQDYRRRNSERVYQAEVTAVRAVVGTPEQRCWIEKEQVVQPQQSGVNVTGAVAGAVIGGILGHQIGRGGGRNVATAGGAVAGGLLGANIDRITGRPQAQEHDVQRCDTVPSQAPTYWDVSYNFRGRDHRVQMTSQPGPTVTVNEQGEPRS